MPSPKLNIALNGLGRIGRVFLRQAYNNPHFNIVAINSRSGLETYAHLIKYDSTYGVSDKDVEIKGNNLVLGGVDIPFVQLDDKNFGWDKLGVDLVFDATGHYTKKQDAVKHMEGGAKHVVISAPMDDPDETFVYGINHKTFDPAKHKIISAASCTTVCSTLVTKVLEENFGMEKGFINTVHAFTSDQSILDSSHKDLRRARTASQSIIPTSSGVSKTITKIYPHLKGKISALSLRVPVPDPSVVVYTATLKKDTTAEEVNRAFIKAAGGELKDHLAVSDLPLVSIDFKQNPNGAIIDLLSTEVVDGNMLNLLAWYDNEWGYVHQAMFLLEHLAKTIVK